MEGLVVQIPSGQMKPGDCEGTFESNNPLCIEKCVWRVRCEKLTKENINKAQKEEPVEPPAEESSLEPDPIEHLLVLLSSKFDSQVQEKEGVRTYFFRGKGKPVAVVVIAPSGKVKIQSSKGSKVLDRIESLAQAEEVVKEMVG